VQYINKGIYQIKLRQQTFQCHRLQLLFSVDFHVVYNFATQINHVQSLSIWTSSM